MRYQYIIFGNSYPYYSVAYSDLKDLNNVMYLEGTNPLYGGRLIKIICRLIFSVKVNKIISMPFKSYFGKFYVPKNVSAHDDLCFIFMINLSVIRVLPYIRKKFPTARCVFYAQDILIKSGVDNITDFLKLFDLTISYDRHDADRYGMLYYQTPFTVIPLEEDENYKSDVYYLGIVKDRLSDILKVFDYFNSLSLKCNFILYGQIPDNIKRQYPTIKFINSLLPYMENLKYVKNTKCVLEIMQKGAVGITPRLWESLAYDKLFITNNKFIVSSGYYNSVFMKVIEEDNYTKVEKEFFYGKPLYGEDLKKSMSPKNLILYIEEQL